ncbi:autophagy protein Atg22, putative [Talaromyces stipitatus ATCC 10500]|uniref:Autophagy-related protein n=1 Tax=Talaromyces stipitatus (strain ATCC 10500 / CBS 375.48 / QM 6759 / NRRL 1006) TaxID=441959 RepID=B8LT83_TALSN|nr:autophagy protein Atg22, putative [Talaromyces stipitatus ATCC 10500]EED23591.1 autophagy protein Atg22, putative [Talaromyces stipitatus ATCC 10500]
MSDIETSLPPQYPGDDTRPTSKREITAWYSYGWAAEVFVVCAMGSFLPITLEQMARDNGHLADDKTQPCQASQISTFSNDLLLSRSNTCVVDILGLEINTASFAMYTFSLSVLVQALLIVTMSGAADHGSYRKSLLVLFACGGSIATMLFITVQPQIYVLAAILAIIANTCFGSSFVLLNSFLPLLVRHHPAILRKIAQNLVVEETNDELDPATPPDVDTPLLQTPQVATEARSVQSSYSDNQEQSTIALRLSTRISANGMGISYIGALLLQVICILVVQFTHQTTFSFRLVMFLIGLWWFIFTIPSILWLRPRPGPPLPAPSNGKATRSWLGYMSFSWKALGRTIMRARHLKDVGLFLAAWFLLSDGIATVSGTAILFAKTELHMQPAALGLISVIGTLSGVVGAFAWGFLSRHFNLRAQQPIIASVCLLEIIPLYGMLGFIPAIQKLGFLGLQQPWEVYPMGAIYGLTMGGLSAYCRSLFGELIPPGYETAFYALYAITDKGSSVFGPAIVGAITDRYGEIRPSFVFLAILIFCAVPLMLALDVDRGKRDALALAKELDEQPHES